MVVELDSPSLMDLSTKKEEDTEGMSTPTLERGDPLIRNIWKRQPDCILDMRITNLDALSNIHQTPEANLQSFFPTTSKPA